MSRLRARADGGGVLMSMVCARRDKGRTFGHRFELDGLAYVA